MPRLHPREQKVRLAQAQLESLIIKHAQEHELTDIELMQALNSAMQTILKYALRWERHGNEDTPSGLAGPDD